ncbi:hypothetical protein BJY24_007585 [Nocardia transvalensis]|uniref:Uncharacterized protein n=1 Tax=Nocardia transvalensis TaxID=37333 RepID=A0A7W9PN42_9NOCA|nr:hypothetical protein [Nocardia transvalensis]
MQNWQKGCHSGKWRVSPGVMDEVPDVPVPEIGLRAILHQRNGFGQNLRIVYGSRDQVGIGGRLIIEGGVFGVPHPPKTPPFAYFRPILRIAR